MTQCLYFISYR